MNLEGEKSVVVDSLSSILLSLFVSQAPTEILRKDADGVYSRSLNQRKKRMCRGGTGPLLMIGSWEFPAETFSQTKVSLLRMCLGRERYPRRTRFTTNCLYSKRRIIERGSRIRLPTHSNIHCNCRIARATLNIGSGDSARKQNGKGPYEAAHAQ